MSRMPDYLLEPPEEMHGACVECGVMLPDDGWCDVCAAFERREANRDD